MTKLHWSPGVHLHGRHARWVGPSYNEEAAMKCAICGKSIVLVPSAEERAARDVTGKSAVYYRSLFSEHAECTLQRRHELTTLLMKEGYTC